MGEETECLSITLRFLATGNSFQDLKFITRTPPQAISLIVLEACRPSPNFLKKKQIICAETNYFFMSSTVEFEKFSLFLHTNFV